MKVYEAPTLLDAMSSRRHEYETLRDQLLTLKSSFQAIVELDDKFQGKGADAIKGFFGAQIDVVEIWIQLAESNIAFFNGIQGDAEGRNLSGETVELPFLEEDLHQSERRSDEMIAAQQQELQRILNRISDIHPLNVFSRDRFDTHMEEARRHREDTLDSVNRFDEELKREYQHIEVSEQILSGLMRELMESSRQGNHISPLYFNAAAYYSSDAYQLTDDITAQTESYLKFKEAQEQTREPKPIPEEDVNENPITESLNSFKEIAQDMWAGMEKRNEEKFDSFYDFGNYITNGGLNLGKGFMSGLNERAEVATDSGSDFINYLTMGGMDLFNGAVNPDDTYSKEHWLNSFGLAALLAGGAKPGLKVKCGTHISTPATQAVPKVSLTHRWNQIRLRIDDLYNWPMMVTDNGMLIGGVGEPGWSRFSVERTVKEREIGTDDRVGTRGTGNEEKDNYFIGTLKGEKIHLKGVKVEEIIYTKRLPEETAKLRKEFNSSIRKTFLKEFANNLVRVKFLREAGLGEDDIARMKDGLNPKGWQVHHNLPLDDGGTNDFSNLVLIKNDPYHKAVTNEQNALTRGLVPKQSKAINWPIFEDDVYPPISFKGREE
ncbi:MAG: T7SS effector LXG polymorphic toxin [Bacillota bacterium]